MCQLSFTYHIITIILLALECGVASNKIEWDKTNQLLSWYPETDENENQIIIGVTDILEKNALPKRVQALAGRSKFTSVFS